MAATRHSASPTPDDRPATLHKNSPEEQRRVKQASVRLKQLSDATRMQIVLMLDEEERHVADLVTELNSSQPAVSHHLALLRHGKVIAARRAGRFNFYHLTETGKTLARAAKALLP